jgi:hypothetical protein
VGGRARLRDDRLHPGAVGSARGVRRRRRHPGRVGRARRRGDELVRRRAGPALLRRRGLRPPRDRHEGRPPRPSGVPFGVGFALLIPQFYAPAGIRISYGVLVAAGTAWIALSLWNAPPRVDDGARPRGS